MKTSIAIVDYGMGNLRSVSQAVKQGGAGSGRGDRRRSPKRFARPSASCCPARARCPTACASCASPACRKRCSKPRASKPLLGVCVGMQMLFDWSEEGDTPGLGLMPGEVRALSSSKASCRTTAAASRCRRWAGTACARRSRTRSGTASPTAASSTSCTASTRARPMPRHSVGRNRLRRAALPRRWRAIIFSRPSSTPKRAPTRGLRAVSQLPALESVIARESDVLAYAECIASLQTCTTLAKRF